MKRLRFLLIIPVFLCFIIIYFISNAFLRREEPLIHNYIPDEVDVLVEFDIKHFGSAFMYNMLYNSEYFNEKIPLPESKNRRDIPSMGVSSAHNFVFAIERWGSGDFYYLIFELDSKREFDNFLESLEETNKNLVHVSNHEVGIFGFANNVEKKTAQDYLGEVINQNVESIRTKYDLLEKFNWDRDLNIHLNTQAFIEGSKLQDIFASVDLVSSDAILEVEYLSNENYDIKPISGKVLKSKNLHMSSTMKITDLLSTFGMKPNQGIAELPGIKKWSINNLGSLFEIKSGIPRDSVKELYRIKSSSGDLIIDGNNKFGFYNVEEKQKISLITEDKFEILLEPESREKFEAYFISLIDSGYIKVDSSKRQMTIRQFGDYKYKWEGSMFILFPTNQNDVELVDLNQEGSYFYMDFDLNPFFSNIKAQGLSRIQSAVFTGLMVSFLDMLNKFDRVQVSLREDSETIKIESTMSFKNKEGVAIIEMMSAFMNSNFKDLFF